MQGFDYKKAVQALNFFAIKEGGSINKMKAIKLIWLSDRAHLRKYSRPILMDNYYAMRLGPVPSKTKDLAECGNTFLDDIEISYREKYIKPHHDNINFDSLNKVDEKVFSKTDLIIMEDIFENFGKKEEFELSKISHIYPEWKQFEEILNKGERSRIDLDYSVFFEDPDIDHDYFKIDKEHLEISKSIFEENSHIYNGQIL
ncbi:hypothetical protein ES708_21692 [subsurface metagenome]